MNGVSEMDAGADVAVDPVGEAWILGVSVGSELSDASPIFCGLDAEAANAVFVYALRRATLRRARELGVGIGFAGGPLAEVYRALAGCRFNELATRTALAAWEEGDYERTLLERRASSR